MSLLNVLAGGKPPVCGALRLCSGQGVRPDVNVSASGTKSTTLTGCFAKVD